MSEAATILQGDCLAVLPTLDVASVDSVVTDPPYHLTTGKRGGTGEASVNLNTPHGRARVTTGFMGKQWDGGEIAHSPEVWTAALRVAKPGAHLLAFGGTRTFHRLACAIEDAGWEVRDCIMWVYGSGFPKSLNLEDEWDGWGTALKPAWEPIIVARKPLAGTVAANVAAHGTGAMNIDGCRVEAETRPLIQSDRRSGNNTYGDGLAGSVAAGSVAAGSTELGRWPSNLIHDGSPEVMAAFPDAPGQFADASSSSSSRKTQNVYGAMKRGNGREGEPSADSDNAGAVGFCMKPGARRGDSGSAARFFYCAKADRADRDDGLAGMEPTATRNYRTGNVHNGHGGRVPDKQARNNHPTVKPTDLMRYLVRLVTPPKGIVLDPFMGSGSTGRAALLEHCRFVGIELDADYCRIARGRIGACANLFGGVA